MIVVMPFDVSQRCEIIFRFFWHLLTQEPPLLLNSQANPACLEITKWLKSHNLGWATGWITSFSFGLFILFLLKMHKLPLLRRNFKPSTFEEAQKFASILCSSAVFVLFHAFIDFEEIGGQLSNFNDSHTSINKTFLTDITLRMVSAFIVVAALYFLFELASQRFNASLREELKKRPSESANSIELNEEAWRIIDELGAFYAR